MKQTGNKPLTATEIKQNMESLCKYGEALFKPIIDRVKQLLRNKE